MTLTLEVDIDGLQVLPETDPIRPSEVQLSCGFTFWCPGTICDYTVG